MTLGIPRLLLRAGLNYQLRHRWQMLLALVGITMGVAVVLAVDLANAAAKASFAQSSAQLRGAATHRLIGHRGDIAESLYADLMTTPGHPPMAPVITARVRVENRSERFQLIGLDLFAEGQFRQQLPQAIRGETSVTEWLTRPDALALSQSAADLLSAGPGQQINVEHQGVKHSLQVLTISNDTTKASQYLLFTDIASAQVIAAMKNRISHIDLILDTAGIEWMQSHLPPSVKLVDVEEQTQGIVGLSAAFELNLMAMSLLAMLVGMFLIYNAMSFSIVQRRNLFGRLRSLGVQRQEIYTLILAESLMLGLVGTLIGCLLGIWLGQGLTRLVASTISELYYQVSADAVHPGIDSLIKAVLLGIAGTLAAAWLPARQAAHTPPLTTLSRNALEKAVQRQIPRLAFTGCLLLLVGLMVAFVFPGGVVMGFAGLFILIFGAVLITPLTLPLTHRLMTYLPIKGIWRMATRDIDRHISRLGTATAALMVALAASVGVAVMVDSMRHSVSDWLQDLLNADLYITAQGYDDGAYLPDEVVKQVPFLASVSHYSLYHHQNLNIAKQKTRLIAASLSKPSRQGFSLVVTADTDPWKRYDEGQIIISEPLANRLGLTAGDELLLPTPQGELAFTIAAIFRDYASEHGRLSMNLARFQSIWSDQRIHTMALFSDSLDSSSLYQAAIEHFGNEQRLVFTAAGDIYEESMNIFERTFRITEVLRLLSVLVAFIGILSALMAVQLERNKEFAVLRAIGFTRSQVSALIIIESIILGLLASLLALPTGLTLAWVLTDAIQLRAFGWTMPFLVTPQPLLWTVVLGLTAATLASLYPAWQASRRNPAPQLRED